MLKHTVFVILILFGFVLALPELDRSQGSAFVPIPEDGYEKARLVAVEFLDEYLDDYVLGDAEPFYGYDYGEEHIALAFIFATELDEISWKAYYAWNKEYLEHFENTVETFRQNPSHIPDPADPFYIRYSQLIDLEDNFFVLVVGFIESGPVVLLCTSVPYSFNFKNSRPSITDNPSVSRIGYILLMREREMSAWVEPTNLYYFYQYFLKDDGSYLISGKPYDYSWYPKSKPLYFKGWDINNCLRDSSDE